MRAAGFQPVVELPNGSFVLRPLFYDFQQDSPYLKNLVKQEPTYGRAFRSSRTVLGDYLRRIILNHKLHVFTSDTVFQMDCCGLDACPLKV